MVFLGKSEHLLWFTENFWKASQSGLKFIEFIKPQQAIYVNTVQTSTAPVHLTVFAFFEAIYFGNLF